MVVKDPHDHDSFNARSHPASIFGPSEMVPGGYVVYTDGKLRELTNVPVTSLELEEITFVKANIDKWDEPVGAA